MADNINSIWHMLNKLQAQVDSLIGTITSHHNDHGKLVIKLLQQLLTLDTANQLLLEQNQALLKQLLALISPTPATHFIATIVAGGSTEMTPKKGATATADITINDNGTATITLSFLDSDGVATAPPAGVAPTYGPASDAAADGTGSSFTLTPSADGLSCAVAVVQPPPQPLHTGVTFTVTVPSGLAGQTAPQSVQTNPPLDVVAGPASSFVAAVSEP